jgi:hypothetical protein
MQVELLMRRWFDGHAEVRQMPWSSRFRKVTHVFDKRIPRFGQLAVHQERGLTRHVPAPVLSWPIHG